MTELERGSLPAAWTGPSAPQPGGPFHVHAYNDDCFILRQSGRTHFEKPFLYLLFGEDRAMLVDTGAPGVDVAAEVGSLVARWSSSRAARVGSPERGGSGGGRAALPPLIVTHTHGHGDHVAGDGQFAGRPRTTLVGAGIAEVSAFFGIAGWPDGLGSIDLGRRPIDVVPVPGHEAASIAFYDRRTGILLSGDVLYPGRLYVRDGAAFKESVRRLVAFTRVRPVAHVLGAHIENTRTPFVDYPEGTADQPEEHVLELGRSHLLELADALDSMGGGVERLVLRDFTIWPVRPSVTTAG